MKYNRLGSSDLEVSEVCLGTMTFGQQNTESEAFGLLDVAHDRGVTFLDSAEMYPVPAREETQGRSEAIIGQWLAGRDRSRFVVATKVIGRSGMQWIRDGGGLDRAHIEAAVEDSLRRLRTDYIDLYQLHWPDRYVPKFGGAFFNQDEYYEGTPIEETVAVLGDLVRAGKIRHYGLSNETPYGVSRFARAAEALGVAKPLTIQNAYNLLNRTYDLHLAESCHHEGLQLLPYSPLAFGLLTGKYLGGAKPQGTRFQLFPFFGARYLKKVNKDEAIAAYLEVAGEKKLTHLALQFCRSRSFVASTIIGATNLDQLNENLDAFEGELSSQELRGILKVHRKYPDPCV